METTPVMELEWVDQDPVSFNIYIYIYPLPSLYIPRRYRKILRALYEGVNHSNVNIYMGEIRIFYQRNLTISRP